MPYAEARSIAGALRLDLVPSPLRTTPAFKESDWLRWRSQRDRDIRSRLADGDDDTVVNWLLFGGTFTAERRITRADLDNELRDAHDVVARRIDDLAGRVLRPSIDDERLQFVRDALVRHGIEPAGSDGRKAATDFLMQQVTRMLRERQELIARGATEELRTLFDARGLSSDTSLYIDFALESALRAIKANGGAGADNITRVAIVGPGLDFTDKTEGFDFYPPQTIQPFAIVDSLARLGFASVDRIQVTTLDVSPRINTHLEAARRRARAGEAYRLELPLEDSPAWNPELVAYWKALGDRIGTGVEATAPPAGVNARSVRVRPEVVAAIVPRDANIVLQRFEPLDRAHQFDLVIATNILVYYGVFEQALALANVASMLRPGGIFLVNGPVFELPNMPMHAAGHTDVLYRPDRPTGRERIYEYRRE